MACDTAIRHRVGAAVASSVAAASTAGTSTAGFENGFTTGAVIAATAAVLAFILTPGAARSAREPGGAPRRAATRLPGIHRKLTNRPNGRH